MDSTTVSQRCSGRNDNIGLELLGNKTTSPEAYAKAQIVCFDELSLELTEYVYVVVVKLAAL